MFVEDTHAIQKAVRQLDMRLCDFGLQVLERFGGEEPYVKALNEAAAKMINSGLPYSELLGKYNCEFDEIMNGVSPIHPFLEIGGAIRIQVPLPKSKKELNILLTLVLQRYECREKADFLENGFNSFNGKDCNRINLGENAGLFVWNDACNMNNVKHPQHDTNDWMEFNQSLLMVLCSVIYQQADLDAYGKRGRYGAETVRRLIDGHAYQPDRYNPADKTISAFIYDTRDGKPFGVYNGIVFARNFFTQIEDGTWKTCQLPAPTLQLNYTFLQSSPDGVIDPGRNAGPTEIKPRFTDKIVAALLIKASRLTQCPVEDFFITIHTDKCAAAKSAEKYMRIIESNKDCYREISRKVWTNIMHNRLKKFRSAMETPAWPSLFFADLSTVERGDPAEEVPLGSDRFYRAIYPSYVELVKSRTGRVLYDRLVNGRFVAEELHAYSQSIRIDLRQLANIVENSKFRNSNKQLVPLVVDGRINEHWQMNSRDSWKTLDLKWDELRIHDEKKRVELGKLLNKMAKDGNTANSSSQVSENPNVDLDVPRLTEFAFILTGNLMMLDGNNKYTRVGQAIRDLTSRFPLIARL